MPTLGPHADALGHAGALQKVPATKQDRTLEWLRWLERTQHAPVCALHVRPGLPVALVGDRLYLVALVARNERFVLDLYAFDLSLANINVIIHN